MSAPTPRQAQFIAQLLFERTAATGELSVFISRKLVSEAKALWPRLAGLRGWSKTNVRRRFNVVAYHHPAQLCWDWFISVELAPQLHWRQLLRWIGWYRTPTGRLQSAWLRIPGLIEFSLHRQDYGWMLSRVGEHRLQSLVDHHLPPASRQFADQSDTAGARRVG